MNKNSILRNYNGRKIEGRNSPKGDGAVATRDCNESQETKITWRTEKQESPGLNELLYLVDYFWQQNVPKCVIPI